MVKLDRFKELADSCGNTYLAVRWVAQWCRALGAEYKNYHICESKLLTWVVTGHCPYVKSQLEVRRKIIDDDGINEFLEWVTDDEIIDEVHELYKKSVKQHHLVECTRNDFSDGRRGRANILLRMIWYSV